MGRPPSDRPRGRPALTPEQKAANKAAREAARAADPAKANAKKRAEEAFTKPKAERPSSGAPKSATRDEPKTMHVGDMTPDQHFAKLLEHSRKLAAHDAKVLEATTARKGARDLARAELGKSALHEIKFFEQCQSEEGQEKWKETVAWQLRVARWAEMPVGHIEDLFGEDRTPVEDKAKADGKRVGLDGGNGTPPDRYASGVLQQRWMEGWSEGQAVLAKGFQPTSANKPAAEPVTAPEAEAEEDPVEEAEPVPDTSDSPVTIAAVPELTPDDGPAYWLAKGAAGFRAGHSRTVPANVPFDQAANYETGYDNAAEANKRAAMRAA